MTAFLDVTMHRFLQVERRFRGVFCSIIREISTRLHGATTQKTVIFVFIPVAMRTSYFNFKKYFAKQVEVYSKLDYTKV
jgi:hypothetical protein